MLLISILNSHGQITGHDSLTEDFAEAKPKDRAKIAKREAKEAPNDEQYQQVMKDAEKAFQEERFEDALDLFKQARGMRPYNVYPKVKIEDLHTLLGITEEEKKAPPIEGPTTKVADIITVAPEEISTPVVTTPARPAPPIERIKPIAEPPVYKPQPRVEIQARADGREDKLFKDGSRMVTERMLTHTGHTDRYRRVSHSWGEVFYFENGRPITVHQWELIFGDR